MSWSRRRRQDFVVHASSLLDELTASVTGPEDPDGRATPLRPAVLEAALGIAGGAELVVLSGTQRLDDERERAAAEGLAQELASRGVTVVLLAPEQRRELVHSQAGLTSRRTHE